MQIMLKVLTLVFLFVSVASSQEVSREQKLQKIDELNGQIRILEENVILPATGDLKRAKAEGLSVFRILPREKYDHKFTVQGGGSYYSFTTKSHDYQKIAQIGLEQGNLMVGFAGANYGFIADLGETLLTEVTRETAEVFFLLNYHPPTVEKEVRAEAYRAYNYDINGLKFKSRIPANVGNSYVLRSISFDSADVLVAFKIHRIDADGSLIMFWKLIEEFNKPTFERSRIEDN